MPEMSSYYYAWVAAQAGQARGLISLYSGAVLLLASWYALALVPERARRAIRTALNLLFVNMFIMLALLLVMQK